MALRKDEVIGLNLRAVRESRGMSQADVAARMSEAGVPGFYPQTITKIEKGSRSLKFEEGLALAKILGHSPEKLLIPPVEFRANEAVDKAIGGLVRAAEDAETAIRDLEVARSRVDLAASSRDVSAHSRGTAELALRTFTVEWALEHAMGPSADEIERAGEADLDLLDEERRGK